MTPEEQIKDLKLQLEVSEHYRKQWHSEQQTTKDYIERCHAILAEAGVPQSMHLHERLLWLVKLATGKDVPMPPDRDKPPSNPSAN